MRVLANLLIIAILLGAAAGTEWQLRSAPRENPLGRQLLYLPTAEYLELLSLGNRGLAADLLYLWSIQYYTQFKPNEQYLYLDKMFGLITDLDPQYQDAYRVGTVIMLLETQADPNKRREAVLKLLDKGIEAMPDDYVLAEEAAWNCYLFFNDVDEAKRYARIAMDRPQAPHRIRRFYGHLMETGGEWSLEASIDYWRGVLESATTDGQVVRSRSHLYDLVAERDRRRLDPLLARFRNRFGRCPKSWRELVDAGMLGAAPLDFYENEYGIDQRSCGILALKKIKE